jgi:DNA polymerase III subunit epsilon
MKRAVILDTETTGLDPKVERCIEVAVCLFDLDLAAPIASYASLIDAGGGVNNNPAEPINRIRPELLVDGAEPRKVWDQVYSFVERADVVLAHQASFDRSFVPESIAKAKPWCCTEHHVDWPLAQPGKSLVHVALAHGVGVVHAHRAMTDVDTIARLLARVHEMGHDLVALLQRAMRPRKKVAALVSYDDREKAKTAGFAWDPPTKTWQREMPVDEIAGLPFKTREIA